MKKILLLSVLLYSILINAQNWKPLNTQEKFNYILNEEEFITHIIYVETVDFINDDSIYYLNHVVDEIDTMPGYLTILGSQFLLEEVLFNDQGLFTFQGKDTFDIHPYASLGESWTFNSSGVTAEIVDVSQSEILGSIDSVKTILLSSNDTIMISKEHGIIKFPCFQDGYYKLVGIEGRDLGQLEPKFHEFYTFEMGDVFQYYQYEYDNFDQYEYTYKYEITGIEESSDSLIVYIDLLGFKDYFEFDGTNSTYLYTDYIEKSDTLIFINSPTNQTNQLPNTPYQLGYGNYGIMGHEINDFGIYTKGMNCNNSATLYQLAANGILEPLLGVDMRYKYSIGLGLTHKAIYGCSYTFGKELVGYVKNGDTTGTVYSDSYLLSIGKNSKVNNSFNAYPNPVSNILTIENIKPSSIVSIYNINQQLVNSIDSKNSTLRLDMKGLKKGMYIIVIKNESGIKWKKIVKN